MLCIMRDYTLFVTNEVYNEINNNNKYDYINLASITKFITLLGFLNCIHSHNIKVTDMIKKIFPKYKYNYRFIDIINHRTRLQNTWGDSDLHVNYNKSKNIYHYVLQLQNDNMLKNKFNYSNYNYDILAYTIYKLEKKYIDKYLKNTILKNVKYKWFKINGKPIASHALFIHTKTMKYFAQNLLTILQTSNLDFFWNNYKYIIVNKKKYYLLGHDGSGGQYMYYNKKLNAMLLWFGYDYKDEDNRPIEKYYELWASRLS